MENLHLCTEVNALKKLADEYEKQLKSFGIELCDLSEQSSTLLNQYADIKMITKLHDLSSTYLDEFYFAKRKEQIEQIAVISQLKAEVKSLTEEIKDENAALKELDEFNSSINDRIVSEGEVERNKISIERTIDSLIKKKESLQIPKDVNIDDLIAKLDTLQRIEEEKNTKN